MLYNSVDNISDNLKISLNTLHRMCETINTPRSLAVSLLLQYQEWEGYLALSIDPSKYQGSREFALDYLVTETLRKNPDMPLGVDRQAAALESFMDSEAQCKRTNDRIRNSSSHDWLNTFRKKIFQILGPLSSSDLHFVEDRFRFGPGASTGVRGIGSSLSDKYDKPFHMTTGLLPFYKSIIGESWWEHHAKSKHTIIEGNRFTTVPKSAKTDRGICVEPTLNMYVQLGIGALLRRKLRRFGLNLNSQDRNRRLAQRAYSDKLSTIDLSAASDSMSVSLIHTFLPERWFELLLIPRSDFCDTGSEYGTIELEKWSSMGNGYTFELETLIFLAVCMTFVPMNEMDNVSVYGDDIIVPQQYSEMVVKALDFLGFKVNTQKSYLAGNFFESCGADFFKGRNVRPFYLKDSKDNIPFSVQVANKLRLYCRRLNCEESCDNTFQDIWSSLVRKSPRIWKRCKVPAAFGDTGIISSFEEAKPKAAKHSIEGYMVRHIDMTPIYKRKATRGVLLSNLARLEASSSMNLEKLLEFRIILHRNKELPSSLFSKGREPKRGYLGKPRARLSVASQWTIGLSWQKPF